MRVFVIGGTGLVGSNIVHQCRSADIPVQSAARSADEADVVVDKTDSKAIRTVIAEFDPDVVIDAAAFQAVDACESERDRAWTVNARGTRHAAIAADRVAAQFIYLSTDYVFSGDPDEAPYTEADPVAPSNYYGRTKYAGEQAARIADEATVLRTSVIYGLRSNNFVTWALAELEAGTELQIVDDQVSTPTYAPDLARACLAVSERNLTGLYHATGPTSLSRFEFTRQCATVCDYDPDLVGPIKTEALGQKAPRPADSSLDSSRLYDAIDYRFREPRPAFRDLRDRRAQ